MSRHHSTWLVLKLQWDRSLQGSAPNAVRSNTQKSISDYRFVNPHVAAVTTGHETSPVPDFSSFVFAFGKNSKGFLKEMFCHLCYRI